MLRNLLPILFAITGTLSAASDDHGERCAAALAKLKANHPEQYAKLDADHDGTVNAKELHAALDRREANFKATHPDLFSAADSDGDGNLSKDEVVAARTARAEHLKAEHPQAFDRVDRNDDGKIKPKEAAHARRQRQSHGPKAGR